ncbi:dihydropteroate synthase [Piscirickettsia litoralis]|uniref:dihydropteroate synthase n=2 Tax=Piscirickettsia litoralis TaxID=1891921 RepID=A0ABX3A5C8_9GAMM|nr:dihydropteroate synthase [Piscirickettsia litoralis]
MGVINCSPNSFYQSSIAVNKETVLGLAGQMIAEGANILDIGGEATNPFVNIEREAPSIQEEIDRVAPHIEAIKARFDILVSVDTSCPEVMRAAVSAGADMINDQRALSREGAKQTVADLKVPVCLMHMFEAIRRPKDSSKAELLAQIKQDLKRHVNECLGAGILAERIIIDPGFGGGNYGKDADENFYLLAHLAEFLEFNLPTLVGLSRKSFIGAVLQEEDFNQRLYGSLAGALLSVQQGAHILRVHDVKATADALKIMAATNAQL